MKKKPKLLSGGNPQIPKADGEAPVQDFIKAAPGWKSDVCRRLDELLTENIRGLIKAVRWNSPFYGKKEVGWFVTYHCFTKYIKVTFFNGAYLNPLPPIDSKDPHTRCLHIGEDGEFDETTFIKWIKQASKREGWGKV